MLKVKISVPRIGHGEIGVPQPEPEANLPFVPRECAPNACAFVQSAGSAACG